MADPTPRRPSRPPTVAEAFFRTGFGCLSVVVVKIAVIVVIVLVLDWREQEKKARLEAERASASETAARLADELAKETDSDGRFVRRPEGPLSENDVWGHPFRLAYQPGRLSDGLEVRSAGPDGEWQTRDDIIATRSSNIHSKTLVREAGSGLFNTAKERLWGKKKDAEKKDTEKK